MSGTQHLDDAALVAAIAGGDQRAFATLHARHVRLAYGIASRLLADAGTAREVTQDAFVDVWRGAADFDPLRGSVTTWLVRIVRMRAIDRGRHDMAARRGGGTATTSIDAALEVDAAVDVAAEVAGLERDSRVRAALGLLPDDQRRVVALAFLGGFTHAELAARLDLPIGTIKTRCFRGLARLRELLDDEMGENR